MKGKLRLLVLVVAMLSMLIVIGGCSKKDKDSSNDETNNQVEDEADINNATDKMDASADSENNDIDSSDIVDEGNEDKEIDETEEEQVNDYIVGDLPLAPEGIKGVFDSLGFLQAGTCINAMAIKDYTDNILQNYNSITMENEMKPDAILNQAKSIEAGDIVVEYTNRTTSLLDWAKTNGIKARGHVLIWHSQTPQWIFYEDFDTNKALVDRDTMLSRMESYIKQNFEFLEAQGYIDIFYAYDIVNEAIEDDGSLRKSKWLDIIGDDFIWHAFYFADKYAPEYVKLYYNDFNEQFKTKYFVELAESLVDEDGRSLIDGLGCQGHLYTKDSIDQYIKMLEAFKATGLEVQITELDISLGTWTNILQATDENLREQGQYYYEFISRIVEGNKAGTTNVSGITFWGVSDGLSWRRERSPLLFDLKSKPKYSYFGVVQDKENAGY